jgi:peptide-methionine (S)-S-oxide reductase
MVARRPARADGARSVAAAAASTAAAGDFVEIHYTGTLDSGAQFDSSLGRDPLAFTLGQGTVVPGFEAIVVGMAVGESRTQRVEPAQAYGEWAEGLVAKVPVKSAPEGLKEGMQVQLRNGMTAVVTAADDEFVSIDANPPLAGQALTFEVELVSLAPASQLQTATFGAGCFWSVSVWRGGDGGGGGGTHSAPCVLDCAAGCQRITTAPLTPPTHPPALMQVELEFQRTPGVVSTQVGYSQGHVENATYEDVCGGSSGHNEVVQVRFDPEQISYEALLDVFWAKHDPTTLNRQGNDQGEQYRSGIYVHSPEQRAAAEASMARVNLKYSGQVVTEIEEVANFSAAEEEHQQYLSRGGRFGQAQSAAKRCTDPIRCYG